MKKVQTCLSPVLNLQNKKAGSRKIKNLMKNTLYSHHQTFCCCCCWRFTSQRFPGIKLNGREKIYCLFFLLDHQTPEEKFKFKGYLCCCCCYCCCWKFRRKFWIFQRKTRRKSIEPESFFSLTLFKFVRIFLSVRNEKTEKSKNDVTKNCRSEMTYENQICENSEIEYPNIFLLNFFLFSNSIYGLICSQK